ncbi:hypothetical protein D9M71_618650 [compost metagenome]
MAWQQVAQQRQLLLVLRGEVGVAALAGQHQRLLRCAGDEGHAQAGTGAQQRAHTLGRRRTGLQGAQLVWLQQGQAVGLGDEVIDQLDLAQAQGLSQFGGIQAPRQIGQLYPLMLQRTG